MKKTAKNFISALLCAVLICTMLSACLGGGENVKNAVFTLTAETETAAATLKGDYAKIDLINPGLDTADFTAVMYSLTEKKETGRVNLGNGVWITGSLKNGFFAIDEKNKNVRFFDFYGKEQFNAEIPTDADFFAASYVSDDGKFLMYANPATREICLYEFSSDKTYVTGKFLDRAEASGYENGVFYIKSGSSCMLSVNTRDKELITLFDATEISLAAKDGGVGFKEDGQLIYIDAESGKMREITCQSRAEVPVNVIPFGAVTYLTADDADIIRIYDGKSGGFREIRTEKDSFLSCTDYGKNGILIITKSGEDFNFELYNIKETEKQTVTNRKNGESATENPNTEMTDTHIIKNVPAFSQMPEYPTGCETVSAIMALRYAGYNITAARFIDNYLPQSTDFTEKDGRRYGPDPNKSFIGSPRAAGGYGCFAAVIEKAAADYLGENGTVINAVGTELDVLCEKYISNNIPVLLWTTISMLDTYPAEKWTLEDGNDFCWPANEHCMLLIGYDGDSFYFNDPYVGNTVKYPRDLTERRYNELGKQAVIITNKKY